MSGVCGIEHYVMTWLISNCEQGSYTCLFQKTLLHNESCEREARRTGSSKPQEMAIQAHQAFRGHYSCFAISCRSLRAAVL